jgi:hypothetical protein
MKEVGQEIKFSPVEESPKNDKKKEYKYCKEYPELFISNYLQKNCRIIARLQPLLPAFWKM